MKKYAETCWLLVLLASCLAMFAAIILVNATALAAALFCAGAATAGLFYSTDTTPIR